MDGSLTGRGIKVEGEGYATSVPAVLSIVASDRDRYHIGKDQII